VPSSNSAGKHPCYDAVFSVYDLDPKRSRYSSVASQSRGTGAASQGPHVGSRPAQKDEEQLDSANSCPSGGSLRPDRTVGRSGSPTCRESDRECRKADLAAASWTSLGRTGAKPEQVLPVVACILRSASRRLGFERDLRLKQTRVSDCFPSIN
jgi:hypothetical protein